MINDIKGFIKRERLFFWLIILTALFHIAIVILSSSGENAASNAAISDDMATISAESEQAMVEHRLAENPVYYFIFMGILGLGIIVASGGLVIDGLYLARWRFILREKKEQFPVPWGVWDVGKVVVIFVFFQYVLIILGGYMSGMGFYPKSGEMLVRIVSATLLDIVLITSTIYFAASFYGRGLGSLGLTGKDLLKGVRYGFLGYIGFVPVLICVVLAVYWLSSVFEVTLEPQAIVEMFKDEKHPAVLFYMSVFAGLLGPLVEEVFFRGFLYGALRKKMGIISGVVISALLFALLHANLASFFPILALGVLLAYLYEKTGSLTASITVHMAHNTLMLIFLFLAKRLYA